VPAKKSTFQRAQEEEDEIEAIKNMGDEDSDGSFFDDDDK